MSEVVISVENLSKQYRLGILGHGTLKNDFQSWWARFRGKEDPNAKIDFSSIGHGIGNREFWALQDVSFEVKQGEVLGIIGRNGAGKSTLLKILSRITAPTKGAAKIKGRVASLLEVGTGFHPELTGRENVYLNGAILGMTKKEIDAKFAEIVDFAEIEKFIDTPVKRYSSGMYVRLAFAVAAHLEPEILIVDEVLAVGDIQFQKKCLNKMEDVTSEGKTVLLVSHNMPTILSLSKRCILLSNGRLLDQGLPSEVVRKFQSSFYDNAFGQTDLTAVERYGTGAAKFLSIHVNPIGNTGETLPTPVAGCDLEFKVRIRACSEIKDSTVALIIYDETGNRLIDVNTLIKGDSLSLANEQEAVVKFLLKNVLLKPDVYIVGLWLGVLNNADIDGIRYATSFRMEARREDILYTSPFPGIYTCEFENKITQLNP